MDDSLGKRTTEPFKVVAAGKQAELKPSVAGLTFDTEATVRNAAGRDYNPVSVIGSLFDVRRTAEPAVKVDKAKMESASPASPRVREPRAAAPRTAWSSS